MRLTASRVKRSPYAVICRNLGRTGCIGAFLNYLLFRTRIMASNAPSRPMSPPSKPVLVFDGQCALCARWVADVQRWGGEKVECVPFQDASVPVRFPNLARETLERSVHLIDANGRVYRGVMAVLQAPGGGRMRTAVRWLCRRSSTLARAAELAYQFIASNRRRLDVAARWRFRLR